MGKRGPPPMPDAIRKLRGRRHRKKEATTAPAMPVGAPPMPRILDGNAVAIATWKRLCKSLTEMQVLGPQHGLMLAVLCLTYADLEAVTEQLRTDGILLKRRGGKLYSHPLVRVQQQLMSQLLRASQEFGLTPSAATRVRAVLPEAVKQDKAKESAEAFLFGGRVVGSIGKTKDGARARE